MFFIVSKAERNIDGSFDDRCPAERRQSVFVAVILRRIESSRLFFRKFTVVLKISHDVRTDLIVL
jgi:hypothetical protein